MAVIEVFEAVGKGYPILILALMSHKQVQVGKGRSTWNGDFCQSSFFKFFLRRNVRVEKEVLPLSKMYKMWVRVMKLVILIEPTLPIKL